MPSAKARDFIGVLWSEIGLAEETESRLRERIELLKAENRELWARIEVANER